MNIEKILDEISKHLKTMRWLAPIYKKGFCDGVIFAINKFAEQDDNIKQPKFHIDQKVYWLKPDPTNPIDIEIKEDVIKQIVTSVTENLKEDIYFLSGNDICLGNGKQMYDDNLFATKEEAELVKTVSIEQLNKFSHKGE